MKLRLYHYWRSSCSWRVRWALNFKAVPCEFAHIDLLKKENRSPEHLLRNPMGSVPVLEVIDDPSMKLKFLTESLPIIEWIEERFPGSPLLGKTPEDRYQIRRLAETVNSGIQPIQNLKVLEYISEEQPRRQEWARHWIRQGLAAFEQLAHPTAGKFCFGDTLTMADLYLIPQCYNALRFDLDLSEMPLLKRIYETVLKTPSCEAAHPDRFKPS